MVLKNGRYTKMVYLPVKVEKATFFQDIATNGGPMLMHIIGMRKFFYINQIVKKVVFLPHPLSLL